MRILLLLTDDGADMDGLPIFQTKFSLPQRDKSTSDVARYCTSFASGPALVAGQAVGRGRWLRSETYCSTESDLATVPAAAADHRGGPRRGLHFRGRSARAGSRPQWRPETIFRRRALAPGFASRTKIVCGRHPPLRYGPLPAEPAAGCGPAPSPAGDRR